MSKLFSLLLLVLLCAGCSRTELVYRNADWLAQRWADGLVDASQVQQAAWRDAFGALLDEHRRDLLPDVLVLLEALHTEAEGGLSPGHLQCVVDAAGRLYRQHARLVTPLATRVLLDLSGAQLDHLARELERRNRDYVDDYLPSDPQQRRQRRFERHLERIERWTGELDAAQRRLVEQAIAEMPDVAEGWLDYRRQQQQRLLSLLHTRPGPEALQAFLDRWWAEFGDRPAALERDTDRLWQQGMGLALALDRQLRPAQRAVLAENIATLRQQLGRAAGDTGGSLLARLATVSCDGGGRASLD